MRRQIEFASGQEEEDWQTGCVALTRRFDSKDQEICKFEATLPAFDGRGGAISEQEALDLIAEVGIESGRAIGKDKSSGQTQALCDAFISLYDKRLKEAVENAFVRECSRQEEAQIKIDISTF